MPAVSRFSLVLALVLFAAGPLLAEEEATERPNIVLIVADDLGYADVGFHGCEQIPTPSIDAIAAGGVRFTQGYVTGPVCSPTRAGLLTGRYQQRFGHEYNTGGIREDASEVGLPTSEETIADLLSEAGYVTGAVGKWHLGNAPKFHPMERGFDEFFGFLGGGHSYLDRVTRANAEPILRGREAVSETDYLTDAFGREAVSFIEKHAKKRFFLYLSFNAVHTPLQATPELLERFPEVTPQNRRTYAAMLASMDDAIGGVVKALEKNGLTERTLLIFLGDNGGPRANASRNDPLRGQKGTVYEGGVRVPFALSFPGRVPEGLVFTEPVVSLDLLPTIAAAAGVKLRGAEKIDGIDLLPWLNAEKEGAPHETLFWRQGSRLAVRHGDLKLLRQTGTEVQLFDLAADPRESKDLAAARPEDVAKLRALFDEWERGTVPPRWSAPERRRTGRAIRRPVSERFTDLDRNGDGHLDPTELTRPRVFRNCDRNTDGKVTIEEARAFDESREGR